MKSIKQRYRKNLFFVVFCLIDCQTRLVNWFTIDVSLHVSLLLRLYRCLCVCKQTVGSLFLCFSSLFSVVQLWNYCCKATRLRSRLISVAYGPTSSLSQVCLKKFGCISPHLPRFQVIEIEALSILKKTSTIKAVSMSKRKSFLFRVEATFLQAKSWKVSEGCTNSYD